MIYILYSILALSGIAVLAAILPIRLLANVSGGTDEGFRYDFRGFAFNGTFGGGFRSTGSGYRITVYLRSRCLLSFDISRTVKFISGKIKTGIHLVMPNLPVTQKECLDMRLAIIAELELLGNDMIGWNSWEDIFDECVYQDNGLRMPGSHKIMKCDSCQRDPIKKKGCGPGKIGSTIALSDLRIEIFVKTKTYGELNDVLFHGIGLLSVTIAL